MTLAVVMLIGLRNMFTDKIILNNFVLYEKNNIKHGITSGENS